jgi:hypothetical protein
MNEKNPKSITVKMLPPSVVHVFWIRSVPDGVVKVYWPQSMN